MTLSTYVNFILPLVVLVIGLGSALLSVRLRAHRRQKARSRTNSIVDTSGLLPSRKF